MTTTSPLTVSDRFALTLDGLCRTVAARIAQGLSAAMILMIWGRLRRIEIQVQGLLTRFRAGRLRVVRERMAPARVSAVVECRPRKGAGSVSLPRYPAWLLVLVPYEAANFASQLRVVLADPEMVALLEYSPQARRVLRPLCRMLGLEPDLLEVRATTPECVAKVQAKPSPVPTEKRTGSIKPTPPSRKSREPPD